MATAYAMLTCASSNNLGDEVQAIAARRWLPRVDRFIDREQLHLDPGPGIDRIVVILNGWFMHRPGNWPPHPKIAPLLTSFHLSRDRDPGLLARLRPTAARTMLRRPGRDYLRALAPIGARDLATLRQLERRNIPAHYSSCLTLTLDRHLPPDPGGETIACDLPPQILAALNARLPAPAVAVTHLSDTPTDPAGRVAKAQQLLDLYARARLVVTTRLHCALPCLAMGTPVLFLTDTPRHYRLQPAMDLAHSSTFAAFLAGQDGYDVNDPPANPQRHLPLREALAAQCTGSVLLRAQP